MDLSRALRHLFALPGSVARAFPSSAMTQIEKTIAEAEKQHGAEIRFAVEDALHPRALWKGASARARALEVFSDLRIWDTAQNNGVLLYLLLADRNVEIVADRGFNGKVSGEQWEQACRAMEAALAAGRYESAAIEGVRAIARLAARHFPPHSSGANELPDRPVVL